MEVFWCKILDLNEHILSHPGRSKSPGSAFAWSLLEYAIQSVWGCSLPEIYVSENGKPFFSNRKDIFFSLSHTKTSALAAVSPSPLGADVEYRRLTRPSLERSLLSVPHGDLDLFELWTLRESWYKLTGQGDLRTIPFSRTDGVVTGPDPNLLSRVYNMIPGCTASVCSFQDKPPDTIHFVNMKHLIKTRESQ